jgi:adenine/guanine phosphoribosyltransferase-like PRPP-binding protein
LPAKETASIQYFRQDKSLPKPFKFAIISNAGDSILIPKKGWKLSSIERRYSVLIRALEEEASKSFKSKIVRRLGHFRRAKNSGGCRLYSYTTDNCVDELKELIREWWSAKRIKSTAIIYDSVNNPSLTEAIQSFSVSKKLFAERLDDVVSHPHLAAEASSHDPCLLVLDVIETGDTFLGHVEALKALDIKVDKEVLAAIAKGGNKQATIGGFSVTAFALKPREPGGLECAQCRLGLPLTSDDRENFWKLRSYDIWEMASKVGWEPEQDIPNVGDGYEIVPKFEEMLLEYGDWIAYKMEKLYTDFKHTDNFFVIHPEEGGANKVSEKLQLRFKNKLSVIKVPRPAIEMAQVANNAWQTVIDEWEEERIWIDQLNSLGEASAIITDIFNASGSTFGSLLALLKHFEISAFCYFPVVDRDCGPDLGGKYQNILRYSLYDWYGPRVLNRVRK